jgi:hypothetical protein
LWQKRLSYFGSYRKNDKFILVFVLRCDVFFWFCSTVSLRMKLATENMMIRILIVTGKTADIAVVITIVHMKLQAYLNTNKMTLKNTLLKTTSSKDDLGFGIIKSIDRQ